MCNPTGIPLICKEHTPMGTAGVVRRAALLTVLLATLTTVLALPVAAQEPMAEPPAAEAPAEAMAPAEPVAPAAAPAAEAEPEDEYRPDYDALVAEQGQDAYAFDFFALGMVWTVVASGLVFIMHLGFAMVESGLTQSKNTVNILFKNTLIPCLGLLTYAVWGFAAHYPGDSWVIPGFLAFGS